MKKKTVILAMSGGVDSSVAAYLLQKKGYSVIGITFKLWPKSFCGAHSAKSCCSLESIDSARGVCSRLNILHYVIECSKLFKKEVIGQFVDSYKKGRTPNPCIRCNEKVKVPLLLKKARELKAEYIATGHHARVVSDKKKTRFFIREAKDKNKDQSYFLFSLSQDVISHLVLPIGDYTKDKIRAISKKIKLKADQRRESQQACFIIDNNLKRFLRKEIRGNIAPGDIKDKAGKVLGRHSGALFYTIGQRRGLRISYGKPLYVTDIDTKKNEIIVGDYKETLRNKLIAEDITLGIKIKKAQHCFKADAKVRYRLPKAKAFVETISAKRCEVTFQKPQDSLAPGQAVVFYQRDRVVGGGWISRNGL